MQDNDYTLYQLITSEEFIQWVKFPNAAQDTFWQQWMEQDYKRLALIEEARNIVLSMSFSQKKMALAQKIALKKRIQQSLNHNMTPHHVNIPIVATRSFIAHWTRYAAAVAVLLLGSIFVYLFLSDSSVSYKTDYGKLATYTLPDSSVVTMNANSELTYRFNEKREVWIKGEAYFQVKKLQNGGQRIPFIVHTEQLDVAVLGTEFNVNTRRGIISVTLSEGKIALEAPDAEVTITMQPGEHAVLDDQNQLTLSKVDTALYTSWRNNKLIFNHTTIGEIAEVIEDIYGYEVIVSDQELQKREFTGTLPTDDLDLFLAMLEEIFDARIGKRNGRIIMK